MRFAFYGRVSTEDQQDPASSRGWQLARASSLIEPHGGQVVAEFFDVGQSRSLPWSRRPQSAALLDALRDPGRGFDAVVIGEPARAFYGNQFGLTFPVFVHYGVGLWVPEVGGAVDPGSEAHELVMSLYGGMSKGERNRIKIRVRSAMASQTASEGRFLGGRPPYGYQLIEVGPHPNPSKAALGQQLHRLEPDPQTAPVVERIFAEWLAGVGLHRLAENLTRDGIISPSGYDRARNPHRTASRGAWGKSAIRAILANPRYTGFQVWNKQRRDEILLDVNDVAAGYETKLRWNDPDDWVWSTEPAHAAIISLDTWKQAQRHLNLGRARKGQRRDRATPHPYVLRGLLRCGLCGRKMQGSWNHDRAHYRCKFAAEYAVVNEIDHPKVVYLREDAVMPKLDGWLAQVFDPANIDTTCQAMADAQGHDETAARASAARAKIADCDRRLANYRDALDLGGPTAPIVSWMAEVEAERLAAEQDLGLTIPKAPLTRSQIKAIVISLKDHLRMLAEADPSAKAELYANLGVSLTYHPDRQIVTVEADLTRVPKSVSEGGSSHMRHARRCSTLPPPPRRTRP